MSQKPANRSTISESVSVIDPPLENEPTTAGPNSEPVPSQTVPTIQAADRSTILPTASEPPAPPFKESDFPLTQRVAQLEARLDLMAQSQLRTNGLTMVVHGEAFCPVCDAKLDGYSPTAIRSDIYKHPHRGAPKLGGQLCEYAGKQFKAPQMFLEFHTPAAKAVKTS